MDTKEVFAQEKFHEISEKLEALHSDFSKFNEENPSNINTQSADVFRDKILALEKEADLFFSQFVYCRARQNR